MLARTPQFRNGGAVSGVANLIARRVRIPPSPSPHRREHAGVAQRPGPVDALVAQDPFQRHACAHTELAARNVEFVGVGLDAPGREAREGQFQQRPGGFSRVALAMRLAAAPEAQFKPGHLPVDAVQAGAGDESAAAAFEGEVGQ